ncbi:hypothetical protein IAR55_004239 [Kwoniella newhampshirensis]|uniref:BHLH domain-containing protein n=1 Tax=Kwoniella newhampshirensis TaxID=1651941 RepID=A0AAW0YJ75_9TREE
MSAMSMPITISRKRKVKSTADTFTSNPNHPPSPSPFPSSPSSPGQEDDEYDPGPSRPTATSSRRPKRSSASGKTDGGTGTKVGSGGGRMSREALRKANHSLIEKRRREKINAALGELRSMVPGLGDEGSGRAGEFKLEVLERTVAHVKELKMRITMLESILPSSSMTSVVAFNLSAANDTEARPADAVQTRAGGAVSTIGPSQPTSSTSSVGLIPPPASPYPSPSPDKAAETLFSPDPNETEVESNLPPPHTKAYSRSSPNTSSRTSTPLNTSSVASLLSSAQGEPQQPHSRPPPPPEVTNPIFLPFPAPSPTSPFLHATIHSSSESRGTSSSSAVGPIDPSPFLAPLPNVSLFGGIFNLDSSPTDTFRPQFKQPSPPQLCLTDNTKTKHSQTQRSAKGATAMTTTTTRSKDMAPEEAANLLLAFSSPDTLRPQHFVVSQRERRSTLDSEEFSLDGGGSGEGGGGVKALRPETKTGNGGKIGKSARDILKMSELQR